MTHAFVHIGMLIVLTAIMVDIAMRLPLTAAVSRILDRTLRATRVLRTRSVSDHWKERAMMGYAQQTILAVGTLTLYLMAIVAGTLAIGGGVELIFPGFAKFAVGFFGLIITIMAAITYLSLRRILNHV